MNPNDVSLRINGTDFGGWKSVRIAAGIERLARDFSLEVTSQWPGSDIARRVQAGQICEVYIGPDKLLTGYIDGTPIHYDANAITVAINGRSKTADLVDCCPVNMVPEGGWQDVDNGPSGPRPLTQRAPIQWISRKLEAIAAYLAKPYKVAVTKEIDTGPAVKNEVVQAGETVFELIDRMMLKNHVLATDNENGDLVFIKPGSGGRAGTALELGKNIRVGDAPLDYKGVYTRYTCYGSRAMEDGEDTATAFSGSATVTDNTIFGVDRLRALTLKAEGQADAGDCRDRVNYEKSHRLGKALETTYTVTGWRQEDGTLWLPNQLVRVRDPIIGFDIDLLIVEVTYILDKEGMRTNIKVGPQSGYLTKTTKSEPNWSEIQVK